MCIQWLNDSIYRNNHFCDTAMSPLQFFLNLFFGDRGSHSVKIKTRLCSHKGLLIEGCFYRFISELAKQNNWHWVFFSHNWIPV